MTPFTRARGVPGTTWTPEPDLSNPNSWPLGPVVAERAFATDASGTAAELFPLPAGPYRAVLETEDGSGKPVTAILPVQVLDPAADRLAIKIPHAVAAPRWQWEPGETFTALWGTGYEEGRAYVEVEHRGKLVQSYWTPKGVTQAALEQGVTRSDARRFHRPRHAGAREPRVSRVATKWRCPGPTRRSPSTGSTSTPSFSRAGSETWTATITGPKAEAAVAEMVAALYDASLDAYLPHGWRNLQLFRQDHSPSAIAV